MSMSMREKRGPSGCVDTIPTCHHFVEEYDACNPDSEYFAYIEPNCPATCGLCPFQQECTNLIDDSYCKFFDDEYNACNPMSSYFYYVSVNCKLYCSVCAYHGEVDFCENYANTEDCEFFNQTYDGCNPESKFHNYVAANCKKYCKICDPEENPVCLDSLQDPLDETRTPEQNCAKMREFCGSGGTLGVVMGDKCRLTCGTCTINS